MNLFLLRHGIAVERDEFDAANDEARPITRKGRRQLRAVAKAMRAMELRFDTILSSQLVRARQTAEIITAEFKLEQRLALANELKPGGGAKKLIQKIGGLKPVVPAPVPRVGPCPDSGMETGTRHQHVTP